MLRSVGLVSGCLVWLAVVASSIVDVRGKEPPEPIPVDPKPTDIVRRLGDPSYRVREQATRQLIAAGLGARDALMRGIEDPDLEIRMGAHRVLVRVLQVDFDAQVAAFLDDLDGSLGSDLPGWKQFKQQAGDDATARQLFAEMICAETRLLEAMASGEPELNELLQERVDAAYAAMQVTGYQQSISTARLATLLYVGGQNKTEFESRITSRMYSLLFQSKMRETVLHGAHVRMMKVLLGGWVGQQNKHQFASYALRLTLKYDLRKASLTPARKTLGQENAAANTISYAAIVLGRFGGEEDIPLLVPHLNNTTVFHTWSNQKLKKEPIQIQVRDAVLAMLVRLSGQEPEDFGFKLLQPDAETIYHIHTLGFLEDTERLVAVEKWNKWAFENGVE